MGGSNGNGSNGTRTFTDSEAKREQVPLLVGVYGASGSGKTMSALRLATGMQQVVGGTIFGIDTEHRRMLHYADQFKFRHVELDAPYSPYDYLDAIKHCVKAGATVLIIDSMSHEHEGQGGVLEWHEKEIERLAPPNASEAERRKYTFSAWAEPKKARRKLITAIVTHLRINLIMCFRAKEKLKIRTGKNPVELGWMPICGEEYPYETTVNCLLYPGSGGVPTWAEGTDEVGEKQMMKLPVQFKGLFAKPKPLDESIGKALAEWARGGSLSAATAPPAPAQHPPRPAAVPVAAAPAAEPATPAVEDPFADRPTDGKKTAEPVDVDDEREPCWAPMPGERRCKLSAGHSGNHVPEFVAPSGNAQGSMV